MFGFFYTNAVYTPQGLDVLEIMRNIHVFVANYCYNLNNQVYTVQATRTVYYNDMPVACRSMCAQETYKDYSTYNVQA